MPTEEYSIGGVAGRSSGSLGQMLEGIGYPLRPVDTGNNGSSNTLVTSNTTAEAGQFLDVTCTTSNITITLPSASENSGRYITVRKADSTGYRVIVTGVKDLTAQNSAMALYSNGTDWVIT